MADWDNRLSHETPTKSRVRGAIEYMEARGIPHSKEDVFRFNAVSHRQGWAMISEGSEDRRHAHTEEAQEHGDHRGRKPLLGAKEIRIEGVSARTVARAMGNTMNYHKCIACSKAWVNASTARQRVEWAKATLDIRPHEDDWKIVRFSDEVHWAISPQGRLYIIRKPGERYCADCIQHKEERSDKEKERWEFKSPLTFYDIASNNNGKMTQKDYIKQILEPQFILEEDRDSGHGPSKSNIVRTWKQKHNLQHYFNYHSSPDLSPIENCWQPPKQYLAIEGWDKRLKDVIAKEGQLTGY
ncbi:hypothetical protein K469DRAFT_734875 [Zopfia rhizophila CBS 207.26]|uniref:Uncharacterized protein n=1 Tax=Zopfia rhizophila CBS 207.26 TaxID=1314779 RepID=A0A6A6EPQ5_9PEZI|nr:hypothetical protein K469DRAFT_734875 [Zopfia rhizophila CBS 207.26]